MTRFLGRGKPLLATALVLSTGAFTMAPCGTSRAAGQTVSIQIQPGTDPATSAAIARIIEERRQSLPPRPLPSPGVSPEGVANKHRIRAIAQALLRARRHEEIAAWSACAKEAGDRLGDATELLSRSHRLDLLRELHLQIGACLSLSETPADAMPHYRTATLLDEGQPARGHHREEAELRLAKARTEILARKRGTITIETSPPGATVWLDGRRLPSVSPLRTPVRLGHHFVSLRRFRYEPQTEQVLLQPGSNLKLVMTPARSDTLQDQLQPQARGQLSASVHEQRLAQAAWAGAAQLAVIAPAPLPARGWRLQLFDATTGARLKDGIVVEQAGSDHLRNRVCQVLGENCEPIKAGIPWYLWPIAATAVTGASIAIGFAIDASRDTVLCPPSGCR
ncbi:MAG: PEGA domain-containing protein [Polyangiaceae bacterium]